MTLKEIIEIEAENQDKLLLFKEGIFWRMYELSAFRFVTEIKELKVTKKAIKSLNTEMISCGFPEVSLSDVLGNYETERIERKEKSIVISGFMKLNPAAFLAWKNSISVKEKSINSSNNDQKKTTSGEKEIIERIRNFQLASKTPIECQQFIHTLQAQLDGSL